MTDWIGETYTSTLGWEHLEKLVDIRNRMAGSPGEKEAAELTKQAFADAGARNCRIEPFEITGWTRGESRLEMQDEVEDCIALPLSPTGSVTAPLVDVGYGTVEDFENADIDGAIVMARSDIPSYADRYIHRREKYFHAVEGGAIGFIYRNHVEGCLPPTGNIGYGNGSIGPIPAVGVSSEVGARLTRRAIGSAVSLSIDAEIEPTSSYNVHAELGPETESRLLLTCHIDAHDIAEGAMDNGAGTAVILEVLAALANRESELETTVEFVAYGSEEVGLVGSTHHASSVDPDSIKAILNADGVVRDRTLSIKTHGFETIEQAATDVADRLDQPVELIPRLGPHSDHWPFVARGIPGVQLRSKRTVIGRGWGHTFADTLDKVDTRNLREQAIFITELAVDMASENVRPTPVEPAIIADQLETEDLAIGMKVTGDWPYEEF